MQKFHFIGIKGSGMSSLAQILHDSNYYVQGSDVEERFFTQIPLEKKGIKLLSFDENNIEPGFTIIAGNAFNETNVEIAYCLKNNISFYRYHEFLSKIINENTSFAVSGAHGKTSTTGLLSHTLKQIQPTSYLIGDGTGYGELSSELFVFEACEYRRHFLAYHPDYAIITNIDFDHPDYFSSIEDVFGAFQTFSKQVKKGLIVCGDDQWCRKLTHQNILYYGLNNENDVVGSNISTDQRGTHFTARHKNQPLGDFFIPVFGEHNVLNALAVISSAILENLDIDEVRNHLTTYSGVKRRFSETIVRDLIVIDDYAHHPAEIKATIQAAHSKYPNKKIVSVFQPHTFSRTKQFLQDFADSFNGSDQVFLCDIFSSAREKSGDLTIHDLIKITANAKYLSFENMDELTSQKDCVVLFMGAGDITKYSQKFLDILSLKTH
jgi:UDP-N-acetylmuramate--alanine ligase